LNQFENTGPPPADRERIKTLPTIQITEEHVGESTNHQATPEFKGHIKGILHHKIGSL
jgi:hypothetical protein